MNPSLTAIAWREMAETYEKKDNEKLIFRSVDEARTLSFTALRRIKKKQKKKTRRDLGRYVVEC